MSSSNSSNSSNPAKASKASNSSNSSKASVFSLIGEVCTAIGNFFGSKDEKPGSPAQPPTPGPEDKIQKDIETRMKIRQVERAINKMEAQIDKWQKEANDYMKQAREALLRGERKMALLLVKQRNTLEGKMIMPSRLRVLFYKMTKSQFELGSVDMSITNTLSDIASDLGQSLSSSEIQSNIAKLVLSNEKIEDVLDGINGFVDDATGSSDIEDPEKTLQLLEQEVTGIQQATGAGGNSSNANANPVASPAPAASSPAAPAAAPGDKSADDGLNELRNLMDPNKKQ